MHSSNHEIAEYQSFFWMLKFGFLSLLWPYLWVYKASIGNISWVWDHTLMSYALEQPEWLRSRARATKSLHNFAWNPLYYIFNIYSLYANKFPFYGCKSPGMGLFGTVLCLNSMTHLRLTGEGDRESLCTGNVLVPIQLLLDPRLKLLREYLRLDLANVLRCGLHCVPDMKV